MKVNEKVFQELASVIKWKRTKRKMERKLSKNGKMSIQRRVRASSSRGTPY